MTVHTISEVCHAKEARGDLADGTIIGHGVIPKQAVC